MFSKVKGIILNEEGVEVSVKDFINAVRSTKKYERADYRDGKVVKQGPVRSRSHFRVHQHDDPYCFLDPEGWTFIRNEFS